MSGVKPIPTRPSRINCCSSGVSELKSSGCFAIRVSGVEQPLNTTPPVSNATIQRIVFMEKFESLLGMNLRLVVPQTGTSLPHP